MNTLPRLGLVLTVALTLACPEPENTSGVRLSSIAVTPADQTTAVGATINYVATGTFEDGTTQDLTADVTWTSSSTSVVSIVSNVATTVSPGQATISAAFDGVTGGTTLTVIAPPTSIAVTPADQVAVVGDMISYTATATNADGSMADVTSTATWQAGFASVATMAGNVATAVGPGQTSIVASLGSVGGSTTLTVSGPPTSIVVTPANQSVTVGSMVSYTATGIASDGSMSDVTSSVIWSTGNGRVAIIAANVVTAVGVGQSTITATLGSVSGSTGLTVTAAPTTGTVGIAVGTQGGTSFELTCWDNTANTFTTPVPFSLSGSTFQIFYVSAQNVVFAHTDAGLEAYRPDPGCNLTPLGVTNVSQPPALGDVSVWDRPGTFAFGDLFNANQIRVLSTDPSGTVTELAPISTGALTTGGIVTNHFWYEDAAAAAPANPFVLGFAGSTPFVAAGGSNSGQGGPFSVTELGPPTVPAGFNKWVSSPRDPNAYVIAIGTAAQVFSAQSGGVTPIMSASIPAGDPRFVEVNAAETCVFGTPGFGGNVIEAFSLSATFMLAQGTNTTVTEFLNVDRIRPFPGPGPDRVVITGTDALGGKAQIYDIGPGCALNGVGSAQQLSPGAFTQAYESMGVFQVP